MTPARLAAAVLAAVLLASPARAEPPIRTTHEMRLDGAVLRYTAEAGRLDIASADGGEVRARMFYVAYRPEAAPASRPVAFVWNGGPGAPSATLHFTSIGPKRLEGERLVDNPQTRRAPTCRRQSGARPR